MKKRRLRGFVLPTIYVMIILLFIVSITFLNTFLSSKPKYADLAIRALKDEVLPVAREIEQEQTIIKPFTSDKVAISKYYYDMNDEETKQEKSLVYYKNTYLQNSGVLYSSDEPFEVLAVLDGTVTNVDTDEILGQVIELTHQNNLKTIYYSLNEVNVKKDDFISQNTILGLSGENSLDQEKENSLLFEVYYNGTTLNPEEFYKMNLKDLQ